MQQKFDEIARDIEAGRTAEALEKAHRLHAAEGADQARLYYLEGRAYMKRSQWTEAIGCFLKSEELDPEGPAAESKRMLQDILTGVPFPKPRRCVPPQFRGQFHQTSVAFAFSM